VFEIYKIYQSTSLYRELKLRGAILTDGQLGILPQEQVYKQLNGVYNLSSDQGNLGVFIITNIRLVWFADSNESFNISLPYMQMINLRIRESKYGLALVIQTAQTAGNYVLGFRIDPQEKLHEVYKELSSLHAVYSQTPIFGVNYDLKATVRLEI
jgi:Bardet-Biedl syndrome 5 protein